MCRLSTWNRVDQDQDGEEEFVIKFNWFKLNVLIA